MRSAYSPMIQIMEARASGSSKESFRAKIGFGEKNCTSDLPKNVKNYQVVAEVGDDGLVFVWVLPEDVLDDHHRLLDDVVDLGLDQAEQGRHAALGRGLHFDGANFQTKL